MSGVLITRLFQPSIPNIMSSLYRKFRQEAVCIRYLYQYSAGIHNRTFNHGCTLCGLIHPKSLFHTSSVKCKKRKTKEEKKMINVNKRSLKVKPDNIIAIWKNMTVAQLAETIGRSVDDVYEIFLYIDNTEDYDQPYSVIDDLKISQKAVKLAGLRFVVKTPDTVVTKENKDVHKRPPPDTKDTVPRAPVITIMGHVDHGKTTLLDSLRSSSIVEGEFGGITQHIGAFEVRLESGNEITFLDTPGHAAFSAMRERGANVTDIVVLVVAADDGVMEQTKESVRMAQEAGVPMIVAMNKIDKPGVDLDRCQATLLNCGVQLEGNGGDVQCVPISALKGTNLDKLLEAILAQAAILDMRGELKGLVEAVIVESKMDPGRGKICTCIVNRGTLRKGAHLVAGTAHAKVRNLLNEFGVNVEKALPGKPVQIMGWRDMPSAGDEILEVESEKRAKEVIEYRKQQKSAEKASEDQKVIQTMLDAHIQEHRIKLREKRRMGIRYKRWRGQPPREKMIKYDTSPKVSMVLKGDVDGSLEALLDVIETYHSDVCPIELMSYGVGPVTESDISMAESFRGSVYAFNVPVPRNIKNIANSKEVPIHEYNIIYRLVDGLKEDISSRLPEKDVDEILGVADVLEEFIVTEAKKKVPVAGCRCTRGQLVKDAKYRLERNLEVLYEGTLSSLRHLKSEVNTIKNWNQSMWNQNG